MRPKALVCDDDALLRSYVRSVVTAHGWEPDEAATALDAIDLAEMLHPDLVIMDLALAGMSGLEAIPRICACCPGSRIVVLSAFDQARDACLRAGAVAVVTKAELHHLDEVLDGLQPVGSTAP